MVRVLIAGIACALAAAPALAQPGAAAAQGPALNGPPVPGVCFLSQQAVIANAKVGVAFTTRLRQIAEQAQTELNTDRAPIEADARALDAQRATLKPADLQERQAGIAARAQALQQKAALRSREIEATRAKALGEIGRDMQPVLAQVYAAHGCGLLLDRSSVLGGNMGGDLTAAVVEGLDQRVSTISFDLETLPPPAPASPAS